MEMNEQKLILRTMETLFEQQLKAVRQLLGEEDVETTRPRKRGARRQSMVDSVVQILDQENRSMHVNELVTLLRDRFGRVTDRDVISSSLSKKARQGILVKQTAPATFDLIERDLSLENENTEGVGK